MRSKYLIAATAALALAALGSAGAQAQSLASHPQGTISAAATPATTTVDTGRVLAPKASASGQPAGVIALDPINKRTITVRLDTAVQVRLGAGTATVKGPETPVTAMAAFWPNFVKVNNALLRAQPNTRSAKLDVSHFGRNVTLYCWVDPTDSSKYVWFRVHPHGSKYTGWMRADLIYWGTYPQPGRCR